MTNEQGASDTRSWNLMGLIFGLVVTALLTLSTSYLGEIRQSTREGAANDARQDLQITAMQTTQAAMIAQLKDMQASQAELVRQIQTLHDQVSHNTAVLGSSKR